jgi:hypothetical protein|tara:strand:- start:235 stop:417 length:183 start_codon:yes stop_codon:yes gene_type:complete
LNDIIVAGRDGAQPSLPSEKKKGKTPGKKTDEKKPYTQTELKRAEQWKRRVRAERELDYL